jgi:hypothetical protein
VGTQRSKEGVRVGGERGRSNEKCNEMKGAVNEGREEDHIRRRKRRVRRRDGSDHLTRTDTGAGRQQDRVLTSAGIASIVHIQSPGRSRRVFSPIRCLTVTKPTTNQEERGEKSASCLVMKRTPKSFIFVTGGDWSERERKEGNAPSGSSSSADHMS